MFNQHWFRGLLVLLSCLTRVVVGGVFPPNVRLPPAHPTVVSVNTELLDLVTVQEKAASFRATVAFTFEWEDPRVNSSSVLSPGRIWVPNVVYDNILKNDFQNQAVLSYNNQTNKLVWRRNIAGFWAAYFIMTKFPFDEQTISLKLSSLPSQETPSIVFKPVKKNLLFYEDDYSILEFVPIDAHVASDIVEGPHKLLVAEYSYFLRIKREWQSYVSQNLVPASLLVSETKESDTQESG